MIDAEGRCTQALYALKRRTQNVRIIFSDIHIQEYCVLRKDGRGKKAARYNAWP